MNNLALNRTLREQARNLGLCDQWYKDWGMLESRQQLIEKYIRGIDFCIKHDYPSLDFARENFPLHLRLSNGIFIDDNVDASNLKIAVLLGKSEGDLRYDGLRSCNVYVRHNSKVNIEAKDGAKVFVETYEDCQVETHTDSISKIFVYRHGGTCTGNAIIKERVAVK